MLASRATAVVSFTLVLAALTACEGRPPPPSEGEGEGEEVDDFVLTAIAPDLERSPLGLDGVDGDVFVVGAAQNKTSLFAHFDGTAWSRIDNAFDVNLFAVDAVAADDVWVGGSGGTILHYDGATFSRQTVPGIASHAVFGVFAAGADDVWACGAQLGRYGFLWHFDGEAWSDVRLPEGVPLDFRGELPGLFSIWGRSGDEVYAAGANGLLLAYDGDAWRVVPTGVNDALFDIHGDADRVVIVGGAFQGIVLDETGASVVDNLLPPLQSAFVDGDGAVWIAGARGAVLVQPAGETEFQRIAPAAILPPQSIAGAYVDDDGRAFFVGGNVLAPPFNTGVVLEAHAPDATPVASLVRQEPPPPPEPVCPPGRVEIVEGATVARAMNELLIDAIRRDIPMPGVHARNLFHVSAAMYDAWAAYDANATGFLTTEKAVAVDVDAERDAAIAFAAYRVITHRYARAQGAAISAVCLRDFMAGRGYDVDDDDTAGDTPAAVGNRVGARIVNAFADDGANEVNDYQDATDYFATNPPMLVEGPGAGANDPDVWQELSLEVAVSQNGIPVAAGAQQYIGSNWRDVEPYALPDDVDGDGLRLPLPPPPAFESEQMKREVQQLLEMSSILTEGAGGTDTIDISPGAYGNNPLATNDGAGHAQNPVTGAPYAANVVPRADFARVLAEFWADGPKSETPPGHWNTLANDVTDRLVEDDADLVPYATGAAVDRLSWEVLLYFALNASVHDAAIAAWGVKRVYLGSRPITLVRTMAERGQSSDRNQARFDPDGLPLVPGIVEVITEESSAPGQRHEHLHAFVDEIAVLSWRGEPGDRSVEHGDVGWIRAVDWIPYQRRNFVTPAFPGYISGHSTFSRAAAEVMSAFTGSAFFPGGLETFTAQAGNYLVFEDGPSVDVTLQWATYFDAADQAGQSRLWGGIHIEADDFGGRQVGHDVGTLVVEQTRALFGRE